MVRIGLARAIGPTFVTCPKFGINWEMKSELELKGLYDVVMGHLVEGGEYGTYLAIREIFGEAVADAASKKEGYRRVNLGGGGPRS